MAGLMELPCCPHCAQRRESGVQSFGVRSYLHLFYEDCAFLTPQDEEEDPQSEGKPIMPQSWYSLVWKASLTAGLLLLLTGGVSLGVGLLLPPQIEAFGEGELLMVDARAAGHNDALRACRLGGVLLLTLGGVILLMCVLASPICCGGVTGGIPDEPPKSPGIWSPPFSAVSPIQLPLPVSLEHTLTVQPEPAF